MKAYPLGHPFTRKTTAKRIPGAILSGLTVGEITQCVTCRVLVSGWRCSWERDDYCDAKSERVVGVLVFQYCS